MEHCGYLYGALFLPVVLIRLVRKVFVRDPNPTSDTYYSPPSWLNTAIGWVLNIEARTIGCFPLPFGTSLYAVASKA